MGTLGRVPLVVPQIFPRIVLYMADSPNSAHMFLLSLDESDESICIIHTIKKQKPTCNYVIIKLTSQGYGVVSDPFENAPFFHGRRLHLWEFPHIWASGLKPPSSFSICQAGQHKSTFLMLYLQFFVFFFKKFFGPVHPTESTVSLHCFRLHMKLFTRCKTCLQIRLSLKSLVLIRAGTKAFNNFHKPSSERHLRKYQESDPDPPHPNPMSCVASTVCASIRNVNITPPHPKEYHGVASTCCASNSSGSCIL